MSQRWGLDNLSHSSASLSNMSEQVLVASLTIRTEILVHTFHDSKMRFVMECDQLSPAHQCNNGANQFPAQRGPSTPLRTESWNFERVRGHRCIASMR